MSFDPAQATAAYIDSLGPEALAKAAAYTSGGHWLLLWGLLVSAVTTWLLIRSGLLERLAARLNRHRKRPNLTAFLVSAATFLLLALLALPWTLYESYFREKGYGRTSQPLADFLGQSATSLAISAVVSGLLFVGVYALIRRAGKSWWIWSGGLVAAGLTAVMLLGPIFIEPIFNDYKPVPAGEVRDALVVQAAAAGVPADRIFVFDGSRQSNNFTANVSGLFGSARIAISDIAFKGASLDEVKAVTGHEIGHYVSGHIWRMVGVVALLADHQRVGRGPARADLEGQLRVPVRARRHVVVFQQAVPRRVVQREVRVAQRAVPAGSALGGDRIGQAADEGGVEAVVLALVRDHAPSRGSGPDGAVVGHPVLPSFAPIAAAAS